MRRIAIALTAVGFLLFLEAAVAAEKGEAPALPDEKAAAEPKPVDLDAVRKMLLAKTPTDKIVEAIRQRGMAFELTADLPPKLKRNGFTDDQIKELKDIQEEAKKAAEAADAAASAQAPYGPRKPEPFQEKAAERVERIIKASGLPLKATSCQHVTLVASSKTTTDLLQFVKSVETQVDKTFPGVIRKGLNPHSAHIVVLDRAYDYKNWIEAMFTVFKEDGYTMDGGGGNDPKKLAIDAGSLITPLIASNGHKETSPGVRQAGPQGEIRRMIAYQVGHLTMTQVAESHSPDALVAGFGDVVETIVHGSPSVMVYTYAPPQWQKQANAWTASVRARLAAKQLNAASVVLTADFQAMSQPEQYAEAWSLVSFLTQKPVQFEQLVKDIRDGMAPMDAVRKHYNLDASGLDRAWRSYIGSHR